MGIGPGGNCGSGSGSEGSLGSGDGPGSGPGSGTGSGPGSMPDRKILILMGAPADRIRVLREPWSRQLPDIAYQQTAKKSSAILKNKSTVGESRCVVGQRPCA